MSRKVMRGWRYFKCKCGNHWRETCRDHETPSRGSCPDDECPSRLTGGPSPYKGTSDETLPTDGHGNLGEGANLMVWIWKREWGVEPEEKKNA